MPDNLTTPRTRAFPFLELAIVLVVLGIIASVVMPRMSRGAADPAAAARNTQDQLLVGRLKTLRTAIAAYINDHRGHAPDPDRVVQQLTTYTDWGGRTSPTKTARHTLGPYLREIPPLPVGAKKGSNTIGLPMEPGAAWTYDSTTGRIRPNTSPTERDPAGNPYASY
jgi:type II secretory pathway pseudopilin PulG